MQLLISVLIFIVVFAILAFGLKWVCDKFFPGFAPALWICGVILLILLLIAASSVFNGGGYSFPWHNR